MIRLPSVALTASPQKTLTDLQNLVDGVAEYEMRVAEGKRLFAQKSGSAAFHPIRKALGQMCAGARRCCYCEDSAATDIEQIWPKDFYPELVFVWDNYLYGCPRCNRPKSNKCDVYTPDGQRISVLHHVKIHDGPPEVGDPLLINPRLEDPMDFMKLDLCDTFFFLPHSASISKERATYTIDLLKLNAEDVLPAARYEAYESYLARLEKYIDRKRKGALAKQLEPIVTSLKKMGHPTVWHEMKRQAKDILDLAELFEQVPEALEW